MIEIRQNKLYDCCLRVYQTANDVDDIHKHFAFVLFLLSRLDLRARERDHGKGCFFVSKIKSFFILSSIEFMLLGKNIEKECLIEKFTKFS